MGVAGLIFEPHPPNLENLHNFERCSNDVKTFFLISLLVSDIKKNGNEFSVHLLNDLV